MVKIWPGLGVFAVCLLCSGQAAGQSGEELLQQARTARDERQFARAIELTRRYLEQQPADGGAHWMLGQLLYWQRDVGGAVHEYERALALLPEDVTLRVDYARMLYQIGRFHSSARVLDAANASNPEASTLRRELSAAMAPWVNAAVRVDDDDQPRRNIALQVEHIRLLSDQVSARAWVNPRLITNPKSTLRETRVDATAGLTWRAPRIGMALTGGASGAAGVWRPIGSALLALPLARGVELNAIASRAPYESTLASLDSLILMSSIDAGLDAANSPRWAGAARIHVDWFDDANVVVSTYAWVLAPIASWLRAGYAGAWQDSRESRWVRDPRLPDQPGPPARADTIAGRYAPYYTPIAVTTHAALIATALSVGKSQVRARAALPIYATEQAPVLLGGQGQSIVRTTFARRYHPWTVAAGWSRNVSPALQWSIDAEYERKTFYRIGRVGLSLQWRPGADAR
jgi:tetratricopeptide (TPR) repeat protein